MSFDFGHLNNAQLDTWGQDATYNGSPLTVIDDKEYLEQFEISGYRMAVACLVSDVDTLGIAVNGTLITGGVTYRVAAEPQRDTGGMALLMLEEQ